jgi:SAM-dependent methyltransferase
VFRTINSLRRDVVRKVRQVGVFETVKHSSISLLRQLRQNDPDVDLFDSKYGVDTARIVSVGALDIPGDKLQYSNRYETVAPEIFFRVMGEIPLKHEDFVFVDLGCGKGRILLLASCFPYHAIEGVEVSPTLCEIARGNIRVFKDNMQKCCHINVRCEDAATYRLPERSVVLYLYDPFDDITMRRVVLNAEQSLRQSPRKMFVVYQRTGLRRAWDESQHFRQLKASPNFAIYESR